jgi:hypothetical protein
MPINIDFTEFTKQRAVAMEINFIGKSDVHNSLT